MQIPSKSHVPLIGVTDEPALGAHLAPYSMSVRGSFLKDNVLM
jgi:hypothetical protein